jgi:hypothetical protein
MLKNRCLFIFMMFLSLTMLAQSVFAVDLPILVEREEKNICNISSKRHEIMDGY